MIGLALARNIAAAKVDGGHAGGQQRGGDRARRTVHEHRTGGNLRAILADADDGRVANVELHRGFVAALVIEPVGAQPVRSGAQVERQPLQFGTVGASRRKTQVAAADQAIERFRLSRLRTGRNGHCQQEQGHE